MRSLEVEDFFTKYEDTIINKQYDQEVIMHSMIITYCPEIKDSLQKYKSKLQKGANNSILRLMIIRILSLR